MTGQLVDSVEEIDIESEYLRKLEKKYKEYLIVKETRNKKAVF
jgi:hypothetical protein